MTNDAPAGRPVRAAVVQAAPVLFDTPRTIDKLAGLAAEAARRRADLVVFPEAFVGGYPKGHDFGVSIGVRTPEGRDEFRRYFEGAIDVPGPATESIGSVAKTHALHLVVGVVERAGGTLYCSSLTFGPDGRLLGTHRKLVPTALERVVWGAGDGSTLPVIDTPLGRIGSAICWENYMPLLRTAMYAKGVELYCAVTVDDRETWVPTVRHVALEGRCFVLSACQAVRRADLPAGYFTGRLPADPEWLIRGGSCVVGPLGQLLAGPVYGEECVLVADLDRADLARAKFDFDVVGHSARPDVFQLTVNDRAATLVEFGGQPPLAGGFGDPGRTHHPPGGLTGDGGRVFRGGTMGVEHVGVWVEDLDRVRDFYVTYLGAVAGPRYSNPAKRFESYFLTLPGGGCRVELMRVSGRPGRPAGPCDGYAHVAVALGSEVGVDALTARLSADGYEVVDGLRRTGDGYYEGVVLDPEGNRVELTA